MTQRARKWVRRYVAWGVLAAGLVAGSLWLAGRREAGAACRVL